MASEEEEEEGNGHFRGKKVEWRGREEVLLEEDLSQASDIVALSVTLLPSAVGVDAVALLLPALPPHFPPTPAKRGRWRK